MLKNVTEFIYIYIYIGSFIYIINPEAAGAVQ